MRSSEVRLSRQQPEEDARNATTVMASNDLATSTLAAYQRSTRVEMKRSSHPARHAARYAPKYALGTHQIRLGGDRDLGEIII